MFSRSLHTISSSFGLFVIQITCFILFAAPSVLAQWQIESPDPITTDSYGMDEYTEWYKRTLNPALALKSHQYDDLIIGSSFLHRQGEFRRFMDPDRFSVYNLSAGGSRTFGESQIFRGTFGYRRTEYHDREWTASRFYDNAHPFVLADSSTGNSRYNEIFVSGEYAVELSPNWTLGAAVDYSVDEGLKDAPPKPLSEYRDFSLRIGFSWQNGSLSAGLHGGVHDKEEELRYRQYEGALLDEVLLISFRGYDKPVVRERERETRLTRQSGLSAGGFSTWKPTDNLRLHGYFRINNSSLHIEEDLTRPRDEGYTSTLSLNSFGGLSWHPSNLSASVEYEYRHTHHWSEFQPSNSLMTDGSSFAHQFTGSIGYRFSDHLHISAKGLLSPSRTSEDDYYSQIFWESDYLGSGVFGQIRTSTPIAEDLRINLGYYRHDAHNSALTYSDSGPYFQTARKQDIETYLASFDDFQASIMMNFGLFEDHTLMLSVSFKQRQHSNNDSNRNIINTHTTYRVPIQ